jgi:hypothetical protein
MQRLGGLCRLVLVDEPHADRGGQDHADDHRVAGLAEERRRQRGHRQQDQQRGPQLTGQYRQGMHPMRTHRVRARHPQPPRRLVFRQAWRSAAQPGQDIIGSQHGGLRRRDR